MKPLVVHPEAEAELQVAAGYYEERVAGLGSEFLEEIGDCFRRVEAAPGSWPVAYGTFRRVYARRFPYTVFYEERPDRISVLAIAHQKRRPGYWRKRGRTP